MQCCTLPTKSQMATRAGVPKMADGVWNGVYPRFLGTAINFYQKHQNPRLPPGAQK